ncbi:LacI family DNA-binding transcriptional regulator [Vagococcus intermedius]|uniref:LacI family DNA-binding transcriptional regulator n=1 Tax=Vagococcus intermedius TaxID=2991418 RepID=A0AAF0CVS1_9ENTE|nr:LacI family DNA-binding transcriptional regulator [Vagococcus intermedius]WEG73895.1 LacI family DNA-binding transcriptional regulator [Vagococcus intermedius]WEG75979.1 LacI family DNA-binding transcriptional regulator [Vagococcus intermedius]
MNIRDIAKLTGCSVSTVSRVLNKHPYVSPEKREKILNVINEVNYIPNRTARNLSYGKSLNIGVLLPQPNNDCADAIIKGVIKEASKVGYLVTILPTNFEKEQEQFYLEELLAKNYDGLIVTSRVLPLDYFEEVAKQAPLVCCENTGTYDISCVFTEREKSYLDLFSEAKKKQLWPIGLILSRDEKRSPSMKTVLKAYVSVFGELDEAYLYRDAVTYEDGRLAATKFMTASDQPKLILANDDTVAAGSYEVFREKQKAITIVGQGNELISKVLNFSTIDHSYKKIGQEAFKHLFQEGRKQIMLGSKFIER